jgi:membrane fusion protein (multidrug efflux system)
MNVRASQKSLLGAPIAMAAITLAGCAGGGATRHHRGFNQGPPPSIPLSTAARATVHPSAEIAGILAPYQNVGISNSLNEPANAVYVIQGDHVRKGQVLATLDVSDLRATYDADERAAESADARATQTKYQAQLNLGQGTNQVTSSRATLLQAQASLRQAQSDLIRDRTLVAQGYLAEQQYQQQETLVRTDQQQVAGAQAALQSAVLNERVNGTATQGLQAASVTSAITQAQSAYAQAREVAAQIARATIVSPVDGIVVNRNLNPGEYPGSRTVFTIQQLDPVYAELNASSSNVFAITRGSPVSLAVAGLNDATYRGRVSAVLGQVQPGSTNFTVEAIVPNPGDRLQSGMAVTGTITMPAVAGVGIPTAAFLDDSHTSVMIEGADGTARQQRVKERGGDGTTSIVSGIALGTKVIANGQLGIVDGQQIASDPNAPKGPNGPSNGGGNRSGAAQRHRPPPQ